ncbi:hypothetical protein L596_019288 [Steinernema carpocapsae]|uniref:Uncharacterized protein n=1 Tax=Steinernema carpocapsae TaxID=34508 RepID=A0A4U5MPZ9_STECR|nr:hypothetical protein L596_019288 [Steinernema carpocapsae]
MRATYSGDKKAICHKPRATNATTTHCSSKTTLLVTKRKAAEGIGSVARSLIAEVLLEFDFALLKALRLSQ